MGLLATIIIGAVVGWVVGCIGYTIDQSVSQTGAEWYFELLWVPAVWGGLLVTVVMLVLWVAKVVPGVWAAAVLVGWIAALCGAWTWSAVAGWMGVL